MNRPVDLWECENCGVRAIGGRGEGWVSDEARPGERWHRCRTLSERLAPRDACQVEMDEVGHALFDCVLGMSAWAAAQKGIHPEAWEAYIAARAALGMSPPPIEDRAQP